MLPMILTCLTCAISLVAFSLNAKESITGNYGGYRDICLKASVDPYYFQNFRSMPEYRCALELTEGDVFAKYISFSDKLLKNIETFRKLDEIGNPELTDYPLLGKFSATNLRYVVLADQIMKFFSLPKDSKIVEIGAGFGGQCYILSQFHPFAHYYIYDLPEVEALIGRVMQELKMDNVQCMPIDNVQLPEEHVDLVISNYAFSECDREMQLEYFENVIKKANRGYIIYNQISKETYGIDSLKLDEFIQLLKDNGFRPKKYPEFLSTAPGNILIVWDNSKGK